MCLPAQLLGVGRAGHSMGSGVDGTEEGGELHLGPGARGGGGGVGVWEEPGAAAEPEPGLVSVCSPAPLPPVPTSYTDV